MHQVHYPTENLVSNSTHTVFVYTICISKTQNNISKEHSQNDANRKVLLIAPILQLITKHLRLARTASAAQDRRIRNVFMSLQNCDTTLHWTMLDEWVCLKDMAPQITTDSKQWKEITLRWEEWHRNLGCALCYPDYPCCPANAFQMSWTTWAI